LQSRTRDTEILHKLYKSTTTEGRLNAEQAGAGKEERDRSTECRMEAEGSDLHLDLMAE